MKWTLVFLLFIFMMGVKIKDGGIIDLMFFAIVVGMFLVAIVTVK